MPKHWYERKACREDSDPADIDIVADRKPYFMRYIYPTLDQEYSHYIENTNAKCMYSFRMSLNDLANKPADELTEEQTQFLEYYHKMIPVGMNACVMNRICWRFENEFDHILKSHRERTRFDYTFMRNDEQYQQSAYYKIKHIQDEYKEWLSAFMASMRKKRVSDPEEFFFARRESIKLFVDDCVAVCSNESQLCNIMLDLCYSKSSGKQFVWDICGSQIVENLLAANDGQIYYPERDPDGDIEYNHQKFVIRRKVCETWVK